MEGVGWHRQVVEREKRKRQQGARACSWAQATEERERRGTKEEEDGGEAEGLEETTDRQTNQPRQKVQVPSKPTRSIPG